MSVTVEVDGRPMKIGVPLVDVMTGMYAAYGVMSALMTRSTTGRGQLIDISLLDCALANLGAVGANALLLNQVPGRYGNGHADVVPCEMYLTSDGHLNLAVGNDSQMVSELDHASEGMVRLVASPIKRNGASIVEPMAPPTLGQHTDEVLMEKLGLSAQRLEALRSSGVTA